MEGTKHLRIVVMVRCGIKHLLIQISVDLKSLKGLFPTASYMLLYTVASPGKGLGG